MNNVSSISNMRAMISMRETIQKSHIELRFDDAMHVSFICDDLPVGYRSFIVACCELGCVASTNKAKQASCF
jgi:hypothetical protein